ncbi:hypothetical protein GP475_04080 [Corynebacterium poyangense]|uniref:Uncharacterized protein n=1 Tax=Corynebacterium poyangense TaxID=2684405 RepID=A0A7H0SS65_9CORY|nr:hypothetical protein [Corynebacterium poyangense]QNQ91390.1 hypothetical protein GP475_04080 [Corynebacterium poyangense]
MRSVLDLPFVHEYSLDAMAIWQISQLSRLGDMSAKNVVVVDTLKTLAHTTPEKFFGLDDVAWSLAPMLRQAASTRQAVWLCDIPKGDLGRVTAILGEHVVHEVGIAEDREGSGNNFIPIALSPIDLIAHWAQGTPEQQSALQQLMEGADTLVMKRSVLANLRAVGANIIERNIVGRVLSNPKVIAYLVVLIYSSLRALPVVFVPGFHGKVWVLWTIDIVTAIPYTWGIIEMFAGKNIIRRLIGLVVTIITFVSPYIYFWFNGRDYPSWVHVFVGMMILGAILIEYLRWLRDRIIARVFYQRPPR